MFFITYKLGASKCKKWPVIDETRLSGFFEIAHYKSAFRIQNGGCNMANQNKKVTQFGQSLVEVFGIVDYQSAQEINQFKMVDPI